MFSKQGNTNDRDRFERFDVAARQTLALAQEEARRFNHNYVGTEHFLLGLLRQEDTVAARALRRLGIELQRVRGAVEFIIGRGDRMVLNDIGLTPRAKKVIELAVDEARRLNHHYIGSEHLLLGLVREGEGIAAGVLASLGVKLERVRQAVIDELARGPGSAESPNEAPAAASPLTQLAALPLTNSARQVVHVALTEAQSLQRDRVEPEHLLLALLREGQSVAAQLLKARGLTYEAAYAACKDLFGAADRPRAIPVFSDGLQAVLTRAVEESRALGQHYVGTEHLLTALLADQDNGASRVLQHLGVLPVDFSIITTHISATRSVLAANTEASLRAPHPLAAADLRRIAADLRRRADELDRLATEREAEPDGE